MKWNNENLKNEKVKRKWKMKNKWMKWKNNENFWWKWNEKWNEWWNDEKWNEIMKK